jgi:hypothetical protein
MAMIDAEGYVAGRLDEQIAYYEAAANRAKRMHLRLQTGVLVLSVLVPVVVNRPPEGSGWLHYVILGFALLLPAMTGLAAARKYSEVWLSYRMAAELLKNEKYLFLTGSGRYRGHPNAFQELVETVESLLSAEHNKFRAFFAEARQAAAAPGAEGEAAPGSAAAGAAGDHAAANAHATDRRTAPAPAERVAATPLASVGAGRSG